MRAHHREVRGRLSNDVAVNAVVPSSPQSVLDLIRPGTHVVVPLANGEPVSVLDALDQARHDLQGVVVHQMHALHDHAYMHGDAHGRLDHRSYFLSPVTRPMFHAGTVELVPCNFSEVPLLLRQFEHNMVVVAAASPPDRRGYFSFGTNADYVASLVGRVPFFIEVNPRMPRTLGANGIHMVHVAGWCEADYPLVEVPGREASQEQATIGALVAERVPDGATIQAGIGALPSAVMRHLSDHRDLGIHTEVITDSMCDLIESGVANGVNKVKRPLKAVGTFALGTQRLYDFLDEHPGVEFVGVDWVNDPRVIAQMPAMTSINATTEVDLLGQCASETIAHPDFRDELAVAARSLW